MYGKFGRGGGSRGGGSGSGGGGGGKRNSFPPQLQRPPSTTSKISLSSRNLSSATPPPPPQPPPSSSSQTDESFNLISGESPSFAAIIRLAPDLVEEIKRVESQGGGARIKFDSNPNNSSCNVIDVGGKEFRFTWSDEMGGLCDIYEERKSGVDGSGLLVESGSLWRKLNVQRVLDESTKKQVKKRSEEYEQKQKSRKAIVLDQCNPSMKKQMQDLAAAEASPWKFKPKNKRYFDPSQVGSHPKHVKPTTGFPTTTNAKATHSMSPLASPQNQHMSLASAFVKGKAMESQTILENPTNIQGRAKENILGFENDNPTQISGRTLEAPVHRDKQGVGALDMRNLLVTLLKDNPKGMSLKALEKAVGDLTSSSAYKIEPILKKIATYEPPGRYILKPGVDLESSKRSYSDSGSSPDDNNEKQFIPQDNQGDVPTEDLEENAQKFDHESNMVEKIDPSQHIFDLFGDDDPPEQNKDRGTRSHESESDSDSDSGSSDSGSDSRSRSLAGSGSASSSDSEGDDSSTNSKEASDVEVDIMSDDNKEPEKLRENEVGWSLPDVMGPRDGGNGDQDQDGYASEDVDIENDFLDDNEAELATDTRNISTSVENMRGVSPYVDQSQPSNRTVNEQEDVEDNESERSIMSASKLKRGLKGIQFDDDVDHEKRSKENAARSSVSRNIGSHTMASPFPHFSRGINEDNHETRNLQMSNQVKDDNANSHLVTQKGYTAFGPGKSSTDKSFKNLTNLGVNSKSHETNTYAQESFPKHEEKGYRDSKDEDDSSNEKAIGKVNESPLDQKHSLRPHSHHKKHSEQEKRSRTGSGSKPSLKDNNSKADFDRSPSDKRRLQRELSDLELGELREPSLDGPKGTKKQKFERVGSFKQSETKLGNSGSQNTELKGKSMSKPNVELGYTSPSNARVAPNHSNSYVEDNARPHESLPPQHQQSKSGHSKGGSLSYKVVDSDRLVQNENIGNQGMDVEGYGETQKKSNIALQREETRQDIGSHKGKGSKSRKSNGSKDTSDNRRDGSKVEGRKDKRKRSEFPLEESNSFIKYEKEEPELKESIKSFSQYKDYVQEYGEKYESYCSIHKILENYKNEFQKLGMDLNGAKGRDTERYNNVLAQLRESYSQCGTRHKRLKKTFLVLHEELKHLKQMIKDFAADYTRDRI